MEINLDKKEYNQNLIQSRLIEIFQSDKYIRQKPENSAFESIKTKLINVIENIISKNDTNNDIDEQLNDKFLELDFGSEYDIDVSKIGINDAIFFINLLNQNNQINYSVEGGKISLSDYQNNPINATNPLLNMLQSSLETKKPIRLDFDNDVTVILKLDSKGKVQAHFIPGSAEVESYLKNNLSFLKQAFDNQNINYSYLGYSKSKDENKNDRNKNSQNQKRSKE